MKGCEVCGCEGRVEGKVGVKGCEVCGCEGREEGKVGGERV